MKNRMNRINANNRITLSLLKTFFLKLASVSSTTSLPSPGPALAFLLPPPP